MSEVDVVCDWMKKKEANIEIKELAITEGKAKIADFEKNLTTTDKNKLSDEATADKADLNKVIDFLNKEFGTSFEKIE
jgi:hypothetical protein